MADKKIQNFSEINVRISTGIKESANDGAVAKVVNKRVNAEIERRAEMLEKALDRYNSAKKDLEKCKPDLISYGVVAGKEKEEVGEPIRMEAYSEKRLKEKQALRKLISELDIAILKAFADNDYTKLQQLCGNGGNNKGKDESAE